MTAPWIDIAKTYLGTKEVPVGSPKDILVSWAHELGGWIDEYYTKDTIPWCGLFVTYVMHRAGYKVYQKGLSAKEWLHWGEECDPKPGAIMVWNRTGGNHVNFCYENIPDGWGCIGGNQHDEVNVSVYTPDRFIGSVWPTDAYLLKK
jgi:uncharacterized protein (TIGR02594 family)